MLLVNMMMLHAVPNLKAVPMVSLHVMTALAYLDLGNVMYTIVIVLDAKMKPIVVVKNV